MCCYGSLRKLLQPGMEFYQMYVTEDETRNDCKGGLSEEIDVEC